MLFNIIAIGNAWSREKSTLDEIIEMTHKAAAFLSEVGDAGLEEFNDKEGRWVWKDTYIFVMQCKTGAMMAHPFSPQLIGKKLFALQDVHGNLIFVDLCGAAKAEKGGWAVYWWNKPEEKTPSRKISYIMPVPKTEYQVGAGIYDEDATIEELKKKVQ